jgi:hypothetical protein
MLPPAPNANEAWYRRRMAEHRQGLARHWPLVLVALGVAIAIGVVSPDRSRPDRAPAPPAAADVK